MKEIWELSVDDLIYNRSFKLDRYYRWQQYQGDDKLFKYSFSENSHYCLRLQIKTL